LRVIFLNMILMGFFPLIDFVCIPFRAS